MSNMTDLWLSGVFFSSSKYSKTRFRPWLCPGPRQGSLQRSPRPSSRLGRRTALPIPFPLNTFGVSISASSAPRLSGPQHKFLATPMRQLTSESGLSLLVNFTNYSYPTDLHTYTHEFVTCSTIKYSLNQMPYLNNTVAVVLKRNILGLGHTRYLHKYDTTLERVCALIWKIWRKKLQKSFSAKQFPI